MTKLTPMDLDALREAYANNPRNLFAEQVVWCLDELKGAREQLGQRAAAPGAPDSLADLRKLYRAYVSLLELGRDRITFLGGSCDSVETMEKNDPALIAARAALAVAPPPVGSGRSNTEIAQDLLVQAEGMVVADHLPFTARLMREAAAALSRAKGE